MVKQYIPPNSLLGTEANLVCNKLIDTSREFKSLQKFDIQNIFEYYDFLLRAWYGLNKIDSFPTSLRKPLEQSRSIILDIKSDFDEPSNSKRLNQITSHMKQLEDNYTSFREIIKDYERGDVYKKLFPVSPTATAFWLKLFKDEDQVESIRFMEALMQYYPEDYDSNKNTFMGQDKKLVKEFLTCKLSKNEEGQIVTADSLIKFLEEKSSSQLKKNHFPLHDVLEYALKAEHSFVRKLTKLVRGTPKKENDTAVAVEKRNDTAAEKRNDTAAEKRNDTAAEKRNDTAAEKENDAAKDQQLPAEQPPKSQQDKEKLANDKYELMKAQAERKKMQKEMQKWKSLYEREKTAREKAENAQKQKQGGPPRDSSTADFGQPVSSPPAGPPTSSSASIHQDKLSPPPNPPELIEKAQQPLLDNTQNDSGEVKLTPPPIPPEFKEKAQQPFLDETHTQPPSEEGVPPPPPPPPPPRPMENTKQPDSEAENPPALSGDLLAEIRKGKKLKKAEPAKKDEAGDAQGGALPKSDPSFHSDLLAAIKGGPKLKKVENK